MRLTKVMHDETVLGYRFIFDSCALATYDVAMFKRLYDGDTSNIEKLASFGANITFTTPESNSYQQVILTEFGLLNAIWVYKYHNNFGMHRNYKWRGKPNVPSSLPYNTQVRIKGYDFNAGKLYVSVVRTGAMAYIDIDEITINRNEPYINQLK